MFIFVLIFALFSFWPGISHAQEGLEYAPARILSAGEPVKKNHYLIQAVKLSILSGAQKGRIIETENVLWDEPGYNTNIKTGDKVVVRISEEDTDDPSSYWVISPYRLRLLFFLLLVFFIPLFFLSGKKFPRVFLSILLNVGIFVLFFIPAIKSGHSPLLLVSIVSLVSVIFTLVLVLGFNRKALGSFIGIVPALILSGAVSVLIQNFLSVTGFFDESSGMLLFASRTFQGWGRLDFFGLVTAGAILVVLGIVIDIAVDISSAVHEIHAADRSAGVRALYNKGLKVGMDVLSTMLSTVLLVFISAALPMILCFYIMDTPFIRAANWEFIVISVVKTLSACFCLTLVVPSTAFAAGVVEKKYG